MLKSDIYYRMGRYKESIISITSLLEIEPDNTIALVKRIWVYSTVDKYEEAITDLNRILEIDPNHINALLVRAAINSGLKEYNKSHDDIMKLISLVDSLKISIDVIDKVEEACGFELVKFIELLTKFM